MASQLTLAKELPTLLMFAHPKCPCTRASVGELERLMRDCAGQVQASIIFLQPPGQDDDWHRTDLWQRASSISGADVVCDDNGDECERFSARTSGLVLVYSTDGQLVFRGGITASRGHEGDNAGRQAITALLRTGQAGIDDTKVYGCLLQCDGERTLYGETPCCQR